MLSQNKEQLQIEKELEEIVAEADQIFIYRMVEWWGSEFTEKNEELDEQVADYIIYNDMNKLYFVLIDSTYTNKLGTYYISIDEEEAEIQFDETQGKLSKKERKIFRVQNKINNQAYKLLKNNLIDKGGYSPSTILIKQKRGYKLYLLSNTTNLNVIPLGNDAIFHGNNQGKIKKWNWYHKNLLPIPISRVGTRVITHKHSNPSLLISPTEIANFRLYGLLYKMNRMPILIEKEEIILEFDSQENEAKAFYLKRN